MKKLKISKTIQWMIKLFTIYLLVFTALRIATVVFFKPSNISVWELGPSFWLGLKYDLRWIAIALSPIIVLSIFKRFSPFYSAGTKKFWTVYLSVVTLVIMFFLMYGFAGSSINFISRANS